MISKENAEIINELLCTGVFEAANCTDADEIVACVREKYPELAEEEIDEYMLLISEQLKKNKADELTEADLANVAGGVTLVALLVIAGAAYAGAKAGPYIGEAIYYWKENRKNKQKKP